MQQMHTRARVAWALLRWLLPLLTALTLFAVEAFFARRFPNRALQKGVSAPFTMRAQSDAVFDLHETRAAEAEEAKQETTPIYDKDNQILYAARTLILEAALARPMDGWSWTEASESTGDGGPTDGEPGDGEPAEAVSDAGTRGVAVRSGSRWVGAADAAPVDAGAADGAPPQMGETSEDLPDDALATALGAERAREIEALVRGCFRLLEPFYKRGVVADTEFPQETRTIRLFSQERFVPGKASQLHRFSELRPALRRGARQFFFKSGPRVRAEVIDFVLQRLPANVTYSQENERFIADISQVTGLKIVLIHRGAVLAAGGDTIDTRAHYAIRASVAAARETTWAERQLGRFGLVAALLLMLGLAGQTLCPAAFGQLRTLVFVHGAILLLFVGARIVLLRWPVDPALIPQVAVALMAAVVLGRAAAVLVAIAVSTCLAFALHFDLTGIVVGAAGGVTAALVVRPRRRWAVVAAGILVGLTQAMAYEACRAAAGRPQDTEQLWSAGQAFLGGLLSGPVGLFGLPFVQRWMGQASRGTLDVLADFDHRLLRRLRERRPEVFAHAVRVMNVADAAAKAVGVDRLLTRVGALLHDIGKTEVGDDLPAETLAGDPEAWRRHTEAHVHAGVRLAREYRIPREVVAFIEQHHGTLPITFGEQGTGEGATGTEPEVAARFATELPTTVEVAIVMLANRVAHATRQRPEQSPGELVQEVVLELLHQRQLVRCPVSPEQLDRMQGAMVSYLEEHR